ncbi:DUF3093 domain-containing protein [Dermabacter sp. p3-SID358]|uniref:DUF3093 domain-containing protein n=1 Tax=Dermabacter sp. p3-SID358 TaxID=2916114 RepID=UPI0021A445CC|nr:DUF3093 domain-containing protein [Dermabacter sp. p3-SID358]MCT1866166.1 DUF3093 domain-containing protein [Dermabacter sp. p3-SID358]
MTAMIPLFHERLHPGPFVTLIAVIFGVLLGAILMPLSEIASVVTAVALGVLFPAILFAASPVVEVREDVVVAGPARIEIDVLGEPRILSKDDFTTILGPEIRPLDFRLVRGWISTGVEVPVVDPKDPTPALVLSLRNPEDFALALKAAQKEGVREGESSRTR